MQFSSKRVDLFGDPLPDKVVNVASVPHRSPFRYPGGKTWFVPRIRQWMRYRNDRARLFVEPFAGGAIIGLTIAFERLADKVILVELDDSVAAVWKTIFSSENEWLASEIERFELTPETVRSTVDRKPCSERELAFQTILKNRTFHSGILAPGAAPIKFGENGKGIKSRWYPNTIADRIRELKKVEERVEFVHGDGIAVIDEHVQNEQAVFFIDPPYTAAGKRAGSRLYKHHELNHEALFSAAQKVAGDFLMTYDRSEDLIAMASDHGFETRSVAMKSSHHAVMNELVVGRNLTWLD